MAVSRQEAEDKLDGMIRELATSGWNVIIVNGNALGLRSRSAPQPTEVLTGNLCGKCGSANVVRTGSCETCMDCGESLGGCG